VRERYRRRPDTYLFVMSSECQALKKDKYILVVPVCAYWEACRPACWEYPEKQEKNLRSCSGDQVKVEDDWTRQG
jgi:hypothetical protein